MDRTLFFKHTGVLVGILLLAASTPLLAVDDQKDAGQVSSWRNAVPKLFGATLVAGGACGAYVYSGALKRYVTEQPLDALKNATFVGGSLLTNFLLWRKVNNIAQERIEKVPTDRNEINPLPEIAAATGFFVLSGIGDVVPLFKPIVPNLKIFMSASVLTVLHFALSSERCLVSEKYDKADNQFIEYMDNLKVPMGRYNHAVINARSQSEIEGRKEEVDTNFGSFAQQEGADFDTYVQQRQAASQQWVIDAQAKYSKLLSSRVEFNKQWKPKEHEKDGQYPKFYLEGNLVQNDDNVLY